MKAQNLWNLTRSSDVSNSITLLSNFDLSCFQQSNSVVFSTHAVWNPPRAMMTAQSHQNLTPTMFALHVVVAGVDEAYILTDTRLG